MPSAIDLPFDKKSETEDSKSVSKTEAKQNAGLSDLLGTLNSKLSEYVSKRYEKEQEWIVAEQQYSGIVDVLDDKKLAALSSGTTQAIPIVNITRPKTNIAIARLQDIQFPLGGDFNFTTTPTPVPELDELTTNTTPLPGGQEGETIGSVAQKTLRTAKDKASRMEAKIHDRFVETHYAKRSRMAMEQTGRLGTGVLKAPVLAHKRRKKYKSVQDSGGSPVQVMEQANDVVPTVQWVDVRMWFPDPSARPGTSILDSFELHLLTPTDLVELSRNPAFMSNRIRDVLRTEPNQGQIAKSHMMSIIGNVSDAMDKRYAVMEYHGPVEKQCLYDLDLIDEKDRDDPLVIIQGEVWFVGNEAIRVSVAPLEGEEQIPYFVCTWEEDQNSILGHGVPYLMRHAARVINSSWLMLLDNAGLTAGPQIVLNKEMIQPANPAEGWEIAPMKIWFMTEYGANVQEAMQFVNVPTQQDSISNIIELAMQFADIESSLPQILQGEMPSGTNTFGGVAMVMSASNIVQRKVSEKWDDCIGVPIVERFYHYEMQYGDDDSLKGDYEVNAGGATERIDKQVKSQDLERIIGMAGSNEAFMEHIDIGLAFREWVATTRVGDILRPMEEIEAARAEQQEAPPPDPALIEAEARKMQAEAAMAKIELDKEMKKVEFELRAQVAEATVDKENREIITRQQENQIKLQIAQMTREDQLFKMANDKEVSLDALATKMKIAVVDAETKRLLKKADTDVFNTEIAIKKEYGEGI